MLCAIAKLSEEATKELESVRRMALPEDIKVKPLYGHITVASYIGENDKRFIQKCSELLEGMPPFVIKYDKIEVLEETFIIVASMTDPGLLGAIHKVIASWYDEELDQWTGSDSWYPHTTLLYSPDLDLQSICGKMNESFEPFSAKIHRIDFSKVTEHGYEIVGSADLLSNNE